MAEAVAVEIRPKPQHELLLPKYPDERAAVAASLAILQSYDGPVDWGLRTGIYQPGDVTEAEVAITLTCTEDCPGCPDRIGLTKDRTKLALTEWRQKLSEYTAGGELGELPVKPSQNEVKASTETMETTMSTLAELGINYVMNLGGTIDKVEGLGKVIEAQLAQGMSVSWFTDGIPQLEENGTPTPLLERNLGSEWLEKVATHVSVDYPFGHEGVATGDLLTGSVQLPPKRGRQSQFDDEGEYSRVFKSQYGSVMMKEMIDNKVRRVVANMTISPSNVGQIQVIYEQMVALQEYATSIGSPTEVLLTFSPWTWRAHQARGKDDLKDCSPEGGLGYEHMPMLNAGLQAILDDTYTRIEEGKPRILANSSAYTSLHAERMFWDEAVNQDVGYNLGKPLMLSVNPAAQIALDPMFEGPELAHVRSTFGYMDRSPDPSKNPFVDFQHGNRPYLPNVIALESLSDEAAQPIRMMDRRLARWIVELGVIHFYSDAEIAAQSIRNKSDSTHTLGNPRLLGSDPNKLRYLGDRIHQICSSECAGNTLFGMVSFGYGLSTAAATVSANTSKPLKNMMLKLKVEAHKNKEHIEGDIDTKDKGILVDDLLFHGETKREAIAIMERYGYSKPRDIVTVIDRLLEHKGKGASLEDDGYIKHSLITMDDIIQYMLETGTITYQQLEDTIADYRMHDRHYLANFAR